MMAADSTLKKNANNPANTSPSKAQLLSSQHDTYDIAGADGNDDGAEAKPLPPHYICNRCQTPGHWMKDCPNNDVFLTFGGGGGVGVAVARPVHNKPTSWDVRGGGGGSSPPHGGDTPSSIAGPSLLRGGGGGGGNETLFSNSNEPSRTDACLQGIGARVQGPFLTPFSKDGLTQNQQQLQQIQQMLDLGMRYRTPAADTERQIQQQIQNASEGYAWSGIETTFGYSGYIASQSSKQIQKQQQASARDAWSGAAGGTTSQRNNVIDRSNTALQQPHHQHLQQLQHQHHGSHTNPYFPPTNTSMLFHLQTLPCNTSMQTALNFPSAQMPVTSALRWSGAVEDAALPASSRSIAENDNTAVDDMHRKLVEEENLRLRERVMRLEAQMELITNKKG